MNEMHSIIQTLLRERAMHTNAPRNGCVDDKGSQPTANTHTTNSAKPKNGRSARTARGSCALRYTPSISLTAQLTKQQLA